jgi:hypothetical protein
LVATVSATIAQNRWHETTGQAMGRTMIGLILALSGWACAGIYLILTGQALWNAIARANASLLGDAAVSFVTGVVSWTVLVYLGSLFGIRRPRLLRKKNR